VGRSIRLKGWLFASLSVVLVAAALSVALWRAHAADPPLWTEGSKKAPAVTTPWPGVAKEDLGAVVNISTTQIVKNPMAFEGGGNPQDPFQQFFQQFLGKIPRTSQVHSLGSGFLIRADGYIVTNNHVVADATDVKVKLADGREFRAKVVGRDEQTDLALVKIEATGLPGIPLGDSDKLQVGDPVMAIGNPFGLQGTVTTGIVSAIGRVIGEGPYDNFIQTDASINPGNSGGPLVNTAGEVVGINTAIFSQSGGSVGIGFAIPINEAKTILPQLQAKGQVTRGWLGVGIQAVTPELVKALHLPKDEGALVAQVQANSPAAAAGLKPGDVIVEYEGHPVSRMAELPRLVAATPIGQSASLKVLRDGQPLTLTATIAEHPGATEAAPAAPAREELGITVQPLTPALAQQLGVPDRSGLVVTGVKDGGPAAEAGLQPGDVILQADRKPVSTGADLRKVLAEHKAGGPVLLWIRRKDISLFVAVNLGGGPQG
jgi:serine protease Do